jgi:hypothetical protein
MFVESLRAVDQEGRRAKGMPKDSTTWLIASEQMGLTLTARMIIARSGTVIPNAMVWY